MTPSPTTYRGTCACATITWTSTTAPTSLDFCHCTQCQRISGCPFIAWLAFPLPDLTFHAPSDAITTTRLLISNGMDSIATRSFCNECGGTLSMQYDCYKGVRVHVAAGTMVSAEGGGLEGVGRAHIWLKDKANWFEVPEDGVVRWEGFDDEFKGVLREFEEGERREEKQRGVVGEGRDGDEDEDLEEEGSEDEVLIRNAVERAKDVMGESDEELQELRRRYGGSGGVRREEEVEEYMDHFDSD